MAPSVNTAKTYPTIFPSSLSPRTLSLTPTLPYPTPNPRFTRRREVRLALSDDFDTPRAVRHLAALCALISTHLKDLEGGALRPVVSAANYAAEALALLGVGSSGGRSGGEIGRRKGGLAEAGGGAGSAEGLPPARDVIEAMVDFRRLARKYVLERNLKKNLASAKLMKR